MAIREKIEILNLLNQVQNDLNSFVNITEDDLEKVYKHIKEKELDLPETIELLKQLFTV